MPRVANPPAGKGRPGARNLMSASHPASPMKLALNDDRVEKAERLKSRQALREVEMNSMQASPMRKQPVYREDSASPRTPRSSAAEARRRAAQGSDSPSSQQLNVVSQSSITPMKRGPILANFEEWMKMATDNKINATNSWNFALIDYFHDMSLLKEGDGVNFQKASCTLDGCVKIYTSRVDSVATETGRLLSGLADSGEGKGGKKNREDGEEGEEGEDDEDDDEEGGKKKTKKKAVRSHEATLAPSFASLQLKKLELEFAVDPLFKKASADFDEGGAKGLLLNHLCIDGAGRIVFDSSDDAGDAMTGGEGSQVQQTKQDDDTEEDRGRKSLQESLPGEEEPKEDGDEDIDLGSLASKFFPDLLKLDGQDICPSMKSFKLGDPSRDLSIPFLKAPDDWKSPNKKDSNPPPKIDLNLADPTGIFLDGTNAAGFDDDDNDGILGGFDMPDNVGFGEGGEAWAKDAALEPMLRVTQAGEGGDGDDEDGDANAYTVQLQHRYREENEHLNILQYFDKAFNSKKGRAAWAKGQGMQGAEYWRIAKIQMAQQQQSEKAAAPRRERKEKEVFEIDFFQPMSEELAELLALPPATNAAISMPRASWKSKGRNLLERDSGEGEWVDVRKEMVRLWLKPKALIRRKKGGGVVTMTAGSNSMRDGADEEEGRKGDYDANFFADDDEGLPFDIPLPIDDDDDGLGVEEGDGDSLGQVFTDAREMLSPPPSTADAGDQLLPNSQYPDPHGLMPGSSPSEMLPGSFGSQLVTQSGGLLGRKLRPEYVNYARVAKKVDVRRLKEEMWRGMVGDLDRLALGADSAASTNGPPTPAPTEPDGDGDVDMMDLDEPAQEQEHKVQTDAEKNADLKFTDMIGGLRSVYPEQQMRDISTSYCFICLLHLANEKGLVLEGGREGGLDGRGMQEIRVRKDESVGEEYVGE